MNFLKFRLFKKIFFYKTSWGGFNPKKYFEVSHGYQGVAHAKFGWNPSRSLGSKSEQTNKQTNRQAPLFFIPYQTFDCVLSMGVDYVKGLSALKLELAWRGQSKLSASSAQNQTSPHSEITFFNFDYELSFCQASKFLKSFVG